MHNFIHVNNYVLKAEHTPDLEAVVVAKLRASAGLVFLDQKEYAKVRTEALEARGLEKQAKKSARQGTVPRNSKRVALGPCWLGLLLRRKGPRSPHNQSTGRRGDAPIIDHQSRPLLGFRRFGRLLGRPLSRNIACDHTPSGVHK